MSAEAQREPARSNPGKLSHDLFHGLSPDEFNGEAQSLADAQAMTPAVRARLKAQLVERLKTPVDRPSWGPDWVRRGERDAPSRGRDGRGGIFAGFRPKVEAASQDTDDEPNDLKRGDRDDAAVIVRNLEKSRQVHHYRGLYIAAAVLAIGIALVAMFVDYQIIRGDVWTRALANEFMVVPASLQSTLVFKSLQVVFAVLIIHFMLKITGVYGRNALVATAFVFALVMIGCLGYLVAYNNMVGGTSATLEHSVDGVQQQQTPASSVDQLFATASPQGAADANASQGDNAAPHVMRAGMFSGAEDVSSLSIPKLSQRTLANANSWLWLAFASVIFFIVSVVAALYLQTAENNSRNVLISRDYIYRRRRFAQLHLLELADKLQNGAGA